MDARTGAQGVSSRVGRHSSRFACRELLYKVHAVRGSNVGCMEDGEGETHTHRGRGVSVRVQSLQRSAVARPGDSTAATAGSVLHRGS